MTSGQQVAAMQSLGYSERGGAFLVNVALHSGYFLMRQYSAKGGKVAHRFSQKLGFFRHATALKIANQTVLFHLKNKVVYRALDQENNRHRRTHNPYQVRSKIMGFDYVLQHPELHFLPTEEEKVAYFSLKRGLSPHLFPTKTYTGKVSETVRFFIDKYPIGVDAAGKVRFCFVDDGAFGVLGFETWLAQYDQLVRAVGMNAEVVYLSPDKLTFANARRQFEQQFAGVPGASSAELNAYFELRKKYESGVADSRTKAAIDTLRKLRKAFTGDAFESQYSRWIGGGSESGLAGFAGPQIAFDTCHLDFSYRFFGVKA